MFKAIYQAVFDAGSFLKNPKSSLIINKYGWLFIVFRWLSYSLIFSFRDYYGRWKPFVSPPFGLALGDYASLQINFSLLIGVIAMGSIAFSLFSYLRLIKKEVSVFKIFNILGITFFLPWLILQPIDFLMISTIGWKILPVVVIHTIFLFWESLAATEILSSMKKLKPSEKAVCISLAMLVWILILSIIWR